ncbi:MAG: bifunctional folylpolyglutamate synthase/dihydrofolate synthase [Solirubrobacterales bacterium]|nr:bifunctional folylpolyglutamate synthase/dihydrofolate synthase [Solirubrobacterales bacterium]
MTGDWSIDPPERSTNRARAPRSVAEGERWLLGLELFGMRFGLDRMRRLLTVLGAPQEHFASIHVVGSNGKSSTTRLLAGVLVAEGLRAGAYLSPHLVSFAERIRVQDADATPEDLAAALHRARRAAEKVDRTLDEPDDRVTQFEALTAAGLDELARREVEVAVVEAGLGGRYDATNILDSRVTVLTTVGLEHTRWLGPTIRDVAREKLAVLRDGTHLVVGADLHPEALEEARAAAWRAGAALTVAPREPGEPGAQPIHLAALGAFQRRNLATALAAAEAFLGRPPRATAVREAAARTLVPGRFEIVEGRATAGEEGRATAGVEDAPPAPHGPTVVLDGAHNPAGTTALAESLPAFLISRGGHRLTLVISVLDDKDAAAMLQDLLPFCTAVVATRTSNPRALPAATLASLTAQLGGPPALVVPDPHTALATAKGLAGPGGTVLATGSLYLLADLKRPRGAPAGATL